MSPPPAVAAADHFRAGRKTGRRMSERRERSDHSEFDGPRPDRNAQGTGPQARRRNSLSRPGSGAVLAGAAQSHHASPNQTSIARPIATFATVPTSTPTLAPTPARMESFKVASPSR